MAGLALAGRNGLTAVEVVQAGLVVSWGLAGAILVTRRLSRRLAVVVLAGVALASPEADIVLVSQGVHRERSDAGKAGVHREPQ